MPQNIFLKKASSFGWLIDGCISPPTVRAKAVKCFWLTGSQIQTPLCDCHDSQNHTSMRLCCISHEVMHYSYHLNTQLWCQPCPIMVSKILHSCKWILQFNNEQIQRSFLMKKKRFHFEKHIRVFCVFFYILLTSQPLSVNLSTSLVF